MSLRLKLSLMLSTFLVLMAIFAVGTLLIFEKMSENMSTIYSASEEHRLMEGLENNLSDFIEVVNNWGFTGEIKFKKQYQTRLADLHKSFGDITAVLNKKNDLKMLENEFQQILNYSKIVIEHEHPVQNPDILDYLQQIDSKGKYFIGSISQMHGYSINAVIDVVRTGEKIKRSMIYYLSLLIVFSSLMSVFLIIRIRRTIAEPFNELLKATERISRGELSYRINMDRRDEFGIVADRFDNMVAELESSNRKIRRKLDETELFLDVARIAGATLDLKDALLLIADTIAFKLRHDNCAIYMLRPEMKAFCLDASNNAEDNMEDTCLSIEDGTGKELVDTLSHVMVDDTEKYKAVDLGSINNRHRSILAVPIIRDNTCSGILVVRNKSPYIFSDDEVNALKILAHTIGSVARNAELFLSTKKQLHKLSVLYELSEAVTSVLELEELLKRIAEEISRLLSSKGCIIRLLENDTLKVKSYFGLPEGMEEEMEISLGEGIAGWVAENGRPLLIEDVSKMPVGMRVPVIKVKSAICVPLKVGEDVIGTIGLYDKYDTDGNLLPFTVDDLNTVEGFASISAIAIEKANIYENEVNREKKTSEEKKRLNILFDSVQGGIITLDRDYNITSANKYIENWINVPSEELIGHNTLDIFHKKVGICPHCAAKATLETGEINSIMQSRGINYAELTAYPIKNEAGEIVECVVFIMDITERVLYQEETLSLYREVIQTKEYMESIIDNSADAIVATDTEGKITSWNQGAEKIFGFSEAEAVGKFLPFLPDFLIEKEKENIEKIKKGEVLKDIETLRQKKDGTIIEVSLALSPIKEASGEVIGISGISRDISEKKHVEKELIRRNQELSRLFIISTAMRGTLEIDKLLRMVLTAVTMSDGMGFNRAILFLLDETKNVLKGAMGVGPTNPEEAWKIWDEISIKHKTLDDIMQEIIVNPVKKDSFLDRLALRIKIPLEEDSVLTRAVKEKRSFNITDAKKNALPDTVLIYEAGLEAYAVVPLISRDRVIGLIWVDNYFNRKQITDEDMRFLTSFSNHVASAIESARLFEQVTMAEKMAALGEVAAKVAHEIRNPLVSIGGFAKRLEKKLDGNLKEHAEIIVKEVDRLENILKEILGFVREVRIAKEMVNLNILIDDVITLMKSDIEDRGIAIVKDFAASTEVFVDPNRSKEAIVNILTNAIQSLKGSGSIFIRTYVTEKYAVIEIEDTGKGIPAADLPFIFDPFFTTKALGTGLGLAITNRIIQEHNGRIEVESEIEKGSIFRVCLPVETS